MLEDQHTIDTENEKIVLTPFRDVPLSYCERIGYIYFVYDDHAIKIGFSFTPENRIKTLQSYCSVPLVLLWKMKGTLIQEQELHHHFRHLKIQGEWFEDNGEIKEFIESLKPQPPRKKIAKPIIDKDFMALVMRRPKIALRRTTEPRNRLAIKEYIFNRSTEAQAISLANLEAIYAGEPVAVQ